MTTLDGDLGTKLADAFINLVSQYPVWPLTPALPLGQWLDEGARRIEIVDEQLGRLRDGTRDGCVDEGCPSVHEALDGSLLPQGAWRSGIAFASHQVG